MGVATGSSSILTVGPTGVMVIIIASFRAGRLSRSFVLTTSALRSCLRKGCKRPNLWTLHLWAICGCRRGGSVLANREGGLHAS